MSALVALIIAATDVVSGGGDRQDQHQNASSSAAEPADAARTLTAKGLALLPSTRWTPELLEDLALGLDALPPRAREFPGGPLEVELHDGEAPFGLCETLLTGRRLHLCAYRDDDDARAMSRLQHLPRTERERLWRRRAIVHAVIRRWDERLRWSARPGWRRISGWRGDDALLVYAWAFSRRAGMGSAALDLATFAEELLVPATGAPDATARCLEPTKAFFLDERLAALDPTWKVARSCPAFDAWAGAAHVRGFEVVFAAPSSVSSQALFGHLLLRVLRDDDEGGATGGGRAVQLAALVSPLEPRLSYVLRGLGGGFRGVYTFTTVADVQYEALGLEQRSLRRFALKLDASRRARLLARLWELERTGYLDYRFFTANCATMLRFALEAVLDDDAPGPPATPWETPTQVLDALAPVLTPVGVDEASGEVAQRARARLHGLRSELAHDTACVAVLDALELDEPPQRIAAYAALASACGAHRAGIALAALRLERARLDVATAARIRLERQLIVPGFSGPTTDELVAARQQRFEAGGSAPERARAELSELLALDDLVRGAPRREPDARERSVLDAERGLKAAFDAVGAVVAGLDESALEAALAEERDADVRLDAESVARSVPEGGQGHLFLAAGASSAGVPLARVRAALIAEELGDQRLAGFSPRLGLRVLDATVDLAPRPWVVDAGALTLVGARSLGPRLGWGAAVEWTFRSGVHDVTAAGEALLSLASDARLTNFVLAFAGVRGGLRGERAAPVAGLLEPRVGLSARVQLPGSFANALRLEVAWAPRVVPAPLQHELGAKAGAVVRLGVVGTVAFSVRAQAEAAWTPGAPIEARGVVGVGFD